MLQIGNFNSLTVKRLSQIGAYLSSEMGDLLLPKKYLPAGIQPGDILTVFVYLDSEDRLVATTLVPKAQVGEFALLTVKEVTPVGAFLDWGLEKDLLVPFGEQQRPMQQGEKCLVRVYLDNSERVAASAKIGRFLEARTASLKVGQQVALVIYEFTDLGAKVIIDGRFSGLLFKSELFGKFSVGDHLSGYVAKVRDDGKVDVTLRKTGVGVKVEGDPDRRRVLDVLQQKGGFLPMGDKTPPQEIAELLKMSKKCFKKVIGNLYREGIIDIREEGVRLKEKGAERPAPRPTPQGDARKGGARRAPRGRR